MAKASQGRRLFQAQAGGLTPVSAQLAVKARASPALGARAAAWPRQPTLGLTVPRRPASLKFRAYRVAAPPNKVVGGAARELGPRPHTQ